MSNVIYLLGEGGGIFKMSLPLNPHIERRFNAHELMRVNQDGTEYTGPHDEAEDGEAPAADPAGKASK